MTTDSGAEDSVAEELLWKLFSNAQSEMIERGTSSVNADWAGIQAIAPRLRAEGMREAARILDKQEFTNKATADAWLEILARADALDPPPSKEKP